MLRLLLILMTVLVPVYLVQAQAQEEPTPTLSVSTGLDGLKELSLKAIQESNGDINVNDDFEIVPDSLVTVEKGEDFHVLSDDGSLDSVKATDEADQTVELIFFPSDGRVRQDLESKAYLLDVILTVENGDKLLYETVLAVLEPGQSLNQVNVQNIIQNFVSSTSESHTTVLLKDDEEEEELSPCYFHPNDDPHCVPVDGQCPDDAPNMNEQGNCHPSGCPDGFSMLDDDETGTCYSDRNVIVCPGSNAKVLRQQDCAIYESDAPVAQESDNGTSTEEEPLDSNCGGVPCTASDKEDSWLSDGPESAPGVPITDEEMEEEPDPMLSEDIVEEEENKGEGNSTD